MFDQAEEWNWQNLSKVQDMGCILTFGVPSPFSVPELVETSAVPDFQ
jgi:hypothetical protein